MTQPLSQGQTRHRQGVVVGQDAEIALGPAQPLRMEGGDVGCGLTGDKPLADGQRFPALTVDAYAGVQVLGDGLNGEAADLLQGFTAEHGGTAGEARAVEAVPALLDQPEEHIAFFPVTFLVGVVACLEGVEVVKGVRGLHEGQLLVREVANHAGDEVLLRHVVSVEDDHELAVAVLQGVVEVSCLGVFVVGASEVAGAQFLS